MYATGMGGPTELLLRAFDVYRGCDSYLDRGEVVRRIVAGQGGGGQRLPFETLFVRPNRFRYQYSDRNKKDLCVVWTEEDEVMSWWSFQPRVRVSESILMALAGPTGVSGGSAYRVPSLLIPPAPYESSWLATSFGAAEDHGRELIDGVATTKLHVLNPTEDFEKHAIPAQVRERVERIGGLTLPELPATRWEWRSLWICASDATIRREAQRINFGRYVMEATTTWKPQVNQPIDPVRFGFIPPNTARA